MFHISKIDLGKSVTLLPKIPETANPTECQKTPRVCFAPSIEQCLVGIEGNKNFNYADLLMFDNLFTVYTTNQPLFQPAQTSDYGLTGEQWALEPIKVKRLGYIDIVRSFKLSKMVVRKTIPIYNDEKKYLVKTVLMYQRAMHSRLIDKNI